ncbi:MAG: CvpA family protein [Lachnospiraceae bacterium]|nr:CvpA family protein [Lachnospiraceae bacterium]MDE6980022.1 CvpA family protein [Lachnospiraceae bacterium]
MNILTIVVLAVIALCAYGGYRQGFLRVVYSLAGWILVLCIVTFSSPYITQYLEEHTKIQENIREKCLEHLQKNGEEEPISVEDGENREKEPLMWNGILLPESVVENITMSAAEGAQDLILNSGVYEDIAESVSHFILEGISFFAAFLLASVLVKSLAGVLDIVSHIPVIKDVNKAFGVMAGGIKGLLIVWLAFYLLAICITSEFAGAIFALVEESPVLLFLYENNILLQVLMIFFA